MYTFGFLPIAKNFFELVVKSLTVERKRAGMKIRIYDFTGRHIPVREQGPKKVVLDISGLPGGICEGERWRSQHGATADRPAGKILKFYGFVFVRFIDCSCFLKRIIWVSAPGEGCFFYLLFWM